MTIDGQHRADLHEGTAVRQPHEGTAVPQPHDAGSRRELPFTSVAFVSALVLLIAESMAISMANTGNPAGATTLALWLNWLTIIPFALGAVGLVRGQHRGWAIAAMIVSVIANPFILLHVLSFFGSL